MPPKIEAEGPKGAETVNPVAEKPAEEKKVEEVFKFKESPFGK